MSNTNGIRIRLDLSDFVVDQTKYRWMFLPTDSFNTISDLMDHVKNEYPYCETEDVVSLYLGEPYCLPSWETIRLLHNGDLVTVKIVKSRRKRKRHEAQGIEAAGKDSKIKKLRSKSPGKKPVPTERIDLSDDVRNTSKQASPGKAKLISKIMKKSVTPPESSSSSDSDDESEKIETAGSTKTVTPAKPAPTVKSAAAAKTQATSSSSDSSSSSSSDEEEDTKATEGKASSRSNDEVKEKPVVKESSSSSSSDEEEETKPQVENESDSSTSSDEEKPEVAQPPQKSGRKRKRKRRPRNRNKLPSAAGETSMDVSDSAPAPSKPFQVPPSPKVPPPKFQPSPKVQPPKIQATPANPTPSKPSPAHQNLCPSSADVSCEEMLLQDQGEVQRNGTNGWRSKISASATSTPRRKVGVFVKDAAAQLGNLLALQGAQAGPVVAFRSDKRYLNDQQTNKSVIMKNGDHQQKKDVDYSKLPHLHTCPKQGNRILFKVLEISENYTPELSGFKKGVVVSVEGDQSLVIQLEEKPKRKRDGKFELDIEEFEGEEETRMYSWADMREVKLINE